MVMLEIVSVLTIYAEYRLALAMFVNAFVNPITDLPAIDAINASLWLLVIAFVVVWSLMFLVLMYRRHDSRHTRHLVEAWFATLVTTFCTILVISTIGLAGLPSFAISDRNWAILSTIWAIYVLQNPATYIIIVAITILAFQVIFQLVLKV